MRQWMNLAAGTLAGGAARYALAGAIYRAAGGRFPYGTLAVNLSGCFLIGLLNSLAEVKFLLGPEAKVMLMIGFCGAFTTFSTLVLETSNLFKSGEPARAFMNVATSVLLGFLLFRLGEILGEVL